MSAGDIILEWVFPLLGGIVGMMLFMVPLRAVLRARRERALGDLNPVPFAAQTANNAGWIAYTYVLDDRQAGALIYWPNQVGFVLGLFFTLSCYGVARSKARDRQLAILLFFGTIMPLIGAIGCFARLSQHALQMLWGFTANAILMAYYTAPLSTVITVFATKSSASLHAPTAGMMIANGGLWFGYGLAIADPFIWVPNGFGAITGTILVVLILVFREKKARSSPATSDVGGGGGGGGGGGTRPEATSSTTELRLDMPGRGPDDPSTQAPSSALPNGSSSGAAAAAGTIQAVK